MPTQAQCGKPMQPTWHHKKYTFSLIEISSNKNIVQSFLPKLDFCPTQNIAYR